MSEICRVSSQNKFVKLVHLVGFVIKKTVSDCQVLHCYVHINVCVAQ